MPKFHNERSRLHPLNLRQLQAMAHEALKEPHHGVVQIARFFDPKIEDPAEHSAQLLRG